ncbi:MAG: hypothetical protein AAF739_07385 [Pseudomonadota bacterium]
MPVYGWVAFAILGTGLIILLVGGDSDTILGIAPEQLAFVTAMLALLVYLGSGLAGMGARPSGLIGAALVWVFLLAAVAGGYMAYQSWVG